MNHWNKYLLAGCFAVVSSIAAISQQQQQLQQLIDLAIENNKSIQIAELSRAGSEANENSALDIDKTMIYFNKDQNNLPPVGSALSVWGIQQKFQFPTVYARQKVLNQSMTTVHFQQKELEKIQLKKEVCRQYYTILYYQELNRKYQALDSLYNAFRQKATGKSPLEKLTAESRWQEIVMQRKQAEIAIMTAYTALKLAVQAEIPFSMENLTISKVLNDTLNIENHPGILYFQQVEKSSILETQVQKSMLMPDIQLEYFQGRNGNPNSGVYNGIQVGIAVPLFYGAQKASIESAQIKEDLIHEQMLNYIFSLYNKKTQLENQLRLYNETLIFYEENSQPLIEESRKMAQSSFQKGEIDFFQYFQVMESTKTMEVNYLKTLQEYNQAQIELNYLCF